MANCTRDKAPTPDRHPTLSRLSALLAAACVIASCQKHADPTASKSDPVSSSSDESKPANDEPATKKAAATATSPSSASSENPPRIAPAGADVNRTDPSLCPKLCQHTQTLRCGLKQTDCLIGCEDMLSVPVCKAQVKRAYQCMASKGVEAFECSPGGLAELKDGYCDQEQGAFAQCFQLANMRAQ